MAISEKSTAKNGEEKSTYSQEDSPVSLFPPLESEKEKTITATSGQKCYESYERFARHGSSLKTCVDYLLCKTEWYSSKSVLIWKPMVMKFNRFVFQLVPSTPPTEGIDSGLLHTPRALMIEETPENFRNRMNDSKNGMPNLSVQVANMLPTPDANMGERGTAKKWKKKRKSGHHAQFPLNEAINQVGGEKDGYKLQPAFAAWMMGFPENWTELPYQSGEEKALKHTETQ